MDKQLAKDMVINPLTRTVEEQEVTRREHALYLAKLEKRIETMEEMIGGGSVE